MKLFWVVVLTIEAAIVIAFCLWASSTDYFQNMPVTVRQGASVWSIIATRAVWLTVVLTTFNASIAAWIFGVRNKDFFSLAGAFVVFVFACGLLAAFVLTSFAQY